MQVAVQDGDTLGAIAQRFGTTIEELLQLNPQITDPNFTIAGQTLEVPDSSAASTTDETTRGNEQITAIIDSYLDGHGQVIVEEAQNVSLPLALACALVEKESGGRNIFGCDQGDVGD